MTGCNTPPAKESAKPPEIALTPAPVPAPASPAATPSISAAPPPAPREFRAAWVSTVSNIDWPSRKDLSVEKQKAEIITILDQAAQLKLNAIILQVRPSADAIYPSEIEPWTEYLSGEQGKAPDPWYDPLQMWIEQAHLRGLELHAWFNPYRARTALARSTLSHKHISKTFPAAVKQYGDLLWMDPAEPAAARQTIAVIADVVRRYDVDGIHIDDYFYPYPIKMPNGQEQEFPDDAAWIAYLKNGGQLKRADWRRQNVNQLVNTIYQRVHEEKNWVKFGISPFGIGRPDRLPAGIAGFSQYDKLYADVELWLANGWLDYLAPQLYWQIDPPAQAFKVLHEYWLTQNTQQRHIWPGIYTSRIDGSEKSWQPDEILNQVEATREKAGGGHIHFSMAALSQNRKEIRQRLSVEKYPQAALIPATPWLGKVSLAAPAFTLLSSQKIEINVGKKEVVRLLAIWKRYDQGWIFSVQAASNPEITLAKDPHYGAVRQLVVSTIDRTGNESARTTIDLP
ncbi:MAG: family 10 glycosylhydrolase [Undibacterium sp.]|nr:family 10 glycosylhydrolase [Undibacterium sp.]